MSSWTTTTYDTDGKLVAHLRLGAYEPTEENLEPSQFSGSFSSSDGFFLTTTGDHYVNADKAIQIEAQDAASLVVGDFDADTAANLKIDVTGSGGYATFKGKGVAINAVPEAAEAKAPTDGRLDLFASKMVSIDTDGDTKLEAQGNVYITNETESNTTTQSKTVIHGLSESLVSYMTLDVTTGFDIFLMAGVRTSVAFYTSETTILKSGYNLMSNSIAVISNENKGFGAYMKNAFGLIGVLMQEDELAEVQQKSLRNGVTGGKLVNKLVGVQSNSVSSQVGVNNTM
tara:strand:- start:1082 stop:1939 length:858 start_codon:yes stop_codon:yes gene_type:complete